MNNKRTTRRTPKFKETEEMRLRFCNSVHLAAIQRNLLRFLATGDFTSRWIILSFHVLFTSPSVGWPFWLRPPLVTSVNWKANINLPWILTKYHSYRWTCDRSWCKLNDFSWPFIDMSLFSDFVLNNDLDPVHFHSTAQCIDYPSFRNRMRYP